MMDIKCWGSRGSISVSGGQYLKYGGDTTCIEICADSGETIIIDAGSGIRELGNSLIKRNVFQYTILFTHSHWDHILGFPFFRPLLMKKAEVFIQNRKFAGIPTRGVMHEVMKSPFFPIGVKDLRANIQFVKTLNDTFSIGSVSVETIPISHPGGGLGYRFTENGKSFVFLTDNELGFDHPEGRGFDAYIDFSKDADLLFHDGEYTTEEYRTKMSWGHSSVADALDLAVKANVKRLGLFHLNQDRTDEQVDAMVRQCRADLKTKNAVMDCFAVSGNLSLHL